MKLLLDTHLLLWAAADSTMMPAAGRMLLNDPQNELLFSAASIWEMISKPKVNQASVAAMRRHKEIIGS